MKTHFYDIESMSNVFSNCVFKPDENMVDVYLLCDDPSLCSDPAFEQLLLQRIHKKNKNFNGGLRIYDLHDQEASRRFARTFGLSDAYLVNDPDSQSTYGPEYRLVCDTDPDYDPDVHPYLLGYNSYNYDTTMLALYLFDAFALKTVTVPGPAGPNGQPIPMPSLVVSFSPPTAKTMRGYNNDLFRKQFKENMSSYLTRARTRDGIGFEEPDYQDRRWKIRKNMLMSGRHLDVARLNEKQSKVALKRLLGMLGLQILESEKLSQNQDTIHNMDELLDLLAYNVSDVVNLNKLFQHKVYKGQFQLKSRLLKTYPELVYDRERPKGAPPGYKPCISQKTVRRDRMCIDSSSAQLTTKALCPYDHLTDIPVVDFLYPDARKAQELGIPQVDVLEETRKFFYDNFPQPELRAQFDRIYNFYASIRGQNFNESKTYREDYPQSKGALNLKRHPKADLNLFYYNADGTPSSCFATFSTGGIHGAEYNKLLFEADTGAFLREQAMMKAVQTLYPNPVDLKKARKVLVNGTEYPAGRFLASGSTLAKSSYKDLEKNRPVLFKLSDDGSTKLNPKYVYTSADQTNHEDFTSYYPNLLRMMMAFFNAGLGYDRYAEIFDNKQNYGFLMKCKDPMTPEQAAKYRPLREATGLPLDEFLVSQEERELYDILRDGTKLMLNSASGAADANFESAIRMNNQIIKMRIIGQLFSYRIAQAQTLAGAKITSTNTDGLYSVLEATLNNKLLAQESKNIGVEIEPEPVYLISKDTNNRIEMNSDNGKIKSASGGTLACRKGPNPTKALAHPAIIDWALTEYLVVAAMNREGVYGSRYDGRSIGLDLDFDDELGMSILKSASKAFPDSVSFLTMFQNVIASSIGSMNYIFGIRPGNPSMPVIMQHYNRVFIMKDGTPDCLFLQSANARKITPLMLQKRRQTPGQRDQVHDPMAIRVLSAHGVTVGDIPKDCDAVIKKVTNIEDNWYMLAQNKDLNYLSDQELDFIMRNLDYDKYLTLLRDGFEKNWRNHVPDAGMLSIPIGPFTAAPVPPPEAKPKKSRKKKDPALVQAEADIQNGVAAAKAILAFGPLQTQTTAPATNTAGAVCPDAPDPMDDPVSAGLVFTAQDAPAACCVADASYDGAFTANAGNPATDTGSEPTVDFESVSEESAPDGTMDEYADSMDANAGDTDTAVSVRQLTAKDREDATARLKENLAKCVADARLLANEDLPGKKTGFEVRIMDLLDVASDLL